MGNLEDVSEEVDVCTSRGGHDGHGERSVDILQVAPHWRLAAIIKSIVNIALECQGLDTLDSFSCNQSIAYYKEIWFLAYHGVIEEITYNLVLKE